MKSQGSLIFPLLILLVITFSCKKQGSKDQPGDTVVSEVGDAKTFSPSDDEASLQSKGVVHVTSGNVAYYIGYQQVSSNNQNPIIAKFVDGVQEWVHTDYETTGDDGKGYGLLYDGANDVLYGVFSATGAQGASSEDFRRFAANGWISSYGSGGGPKVAILAKINPATGEIETASYLYAKLSSGNSNSMAVKGLSLEADGSLVVNADSWYSPLKPNKDRFNCSGSSPFDYTVTFSSDLSSVTEATASGCN